MTDKRIEEREKKALKYIKENEKASLDDICIVLRLSKNPVRALLAKYVRNGELYEKRLSASNEMYSMTPFEDTPEESKDSETNIKVPKDICMPEILAESVGDKYVHIEGIGTISEKKLSELFAMGILTIDIDKLISSLKMGEVSFEKNKIVFEV